MKRILIIGLDGATFKVIKPLVAQGKLPTFKFLLENGAYGILKSTLPFLTVPAWPSFYTGKNPGKHGLFDFLTVHNFDPAQRRVHSSLDVKAKTLWEILSENGKSCLVWNVPLTYPPQKINGIMVGGMLSLPNHIFTYPDRVTDELRGKNYLIDTMNLDFKRMPPDEHFRIMIKCEQERYEIWKKYHSSRDWNFSMIVFRSTDIVGHEFWSDKSKVCAVYQQMDGILGQIIKSIDDETTLLLMSDHGFTDYNDAFNILAWLRKKRYLVYKDANEKDITSKSWRQIHDKETNKNRSILMKILLKFSIDRQRLMQSCFLDIFRKYTPKFIKNKIRTNLVASKKTINWSKTVAYAQLGAKSTWGININLKNREKYGIVSADKYQQIRNEIINELRNVQTPSDDKVFKNVYAREEIYSGKYIDGAPDIIFSLNGKNLIAAARFDDILFSKTTSHTNSYHDQEGIFMAYYKGITKNSEIKDLSILDVAPTVLEILNIKNAEDMDGKVINAAT